MPSTSALVRTLIIDSNGSLSIGFRAAPHIGRHSRDGDRPDRCLFPGTKIAEALCGRPRGAVSTFRGHGARQDDPFGVDHGSAIAVCWEAVVFVRALRQTGVQSTDAILYRLRAHRPTGDSGGFSPQEMAEEPN